MKAIGVVVLIILIGILGFVYYMKTKPPHQVASTPTVSKKGTMKLTSPAFENNQQIPAKYTCDESNVNPPLMISDVPENAKSLVLTIEDPDAPSKTWVHWVLYNINTKITEIPENTVPDGADQGMNDFGKPGYGGPCPPSGTHRYIFTLYALENKLFIEGDPTIDILQKYMKDHIINQSQLIGLYSHK